MRLVLKHIVRAFLQTLATSRSNTSSPTAKFQIFTFLIYRRFHGFIRPH